MCAQQYTDQTYQVPPGPRGSDVEVDGRAFDGLRTEEVTPTAPQGTLYEVKTGTSYGKISAWSPSYTRTALLGVILARAFKEFAGDRLKATACLPPFEYRFGVVDGALAADMKTAFSLGQDPADAARVFVNGCQGQ